MQNQENEKETLISASPSLDKVENRAVEQLVTVPEAAKALGISERSIRRIVAKPHAKVYTEKTLEEVVQVVERLRVSLADLERYRAEYGRFGPQPVPNEQ